MEQTQAYSGMLELLSAMTANIQIKAAGKTGESGDFRKLMEQQTQQTKAPRDSQTDDGSQTQVKAEAPAQPEAAETDPELQRQRMELAAALMAQNPAAPQIQPMEQEAEPAEEMVQAAELPEAEVQIELPRQTETDTRPQEPLPLQQVEAPQTPTVAQAEAPQQAPVQQRTQPVEEAPVRAQRIAQPQREEAQEEEPEVRLTESDQETQQVFPQQEATYVKVSEAAPAEEPQETQAPEKQVEIQLTQALDQGDSRVELTLTPEHLGKVQVEIVRQAGGGIHVAITAEKLHTATLLEKGAAGLQAAVATRSQESVTVQVEHREHSGQPNYDGRSGGQNGQNPEQQQRQPRQQRQQDFLQQLRLGLIPLESA